MRPSAEPTLIGLDVNATRVRAMGTSIAGTPRPLALAENDAELPLAISLEHRHAQVGRAGVRLCRQLPHLACLDFLPYLDQPRLWQAGRHRLDASQALTLVFKQLHASCAAADGLALSVPAYLTRPQVA